MKGIHLLIALAVVISVLPIVIAEDVQSNTLIYLDGPSVVRVGPYSFLRISIVNNNTNQTLTVNSIDVLNESLASIESYYPNKQILPVQDQINYAQQIQKNPGAYAYLTSQQAVSLSKSILNGTYSLGLNLNLTKFDPNSSYEHQVNFTIRANLSYGSNSFILEGSHPIIIYPPLFDPQAGPGWYLGDQHVHSEYSNNIIDGFNIPSISNMTSAAIQLGYSWTIITDHSDFLQENEWNNAESDCQAQDQASTFECIYGQELAMASQTYCDRRHYLAYDSTPSYIDGTCGLLCSCKDSLGLMQNLTNNGGYGWAAHPHITESHFGYISDWEDWSITGFRGLEIINADFSGDDAETISNPGGERDSWTEFLDAENNLSDGFKVGIADSDAHATGALGTAFTYCYLSSLSQTNVVNALRDGHCVATTGPFGSFGIGSSIIGDTANVSSGDNLISVQATSTSEFGQLSLIILYVDGSAVKFINIPSSYSYSSGVTVPLTSTNKYMRMELYTTTGRRAFTNPIWLNVTDCTCTTPSPGSCGSGGCSSDQRQYTRTCTPNSCAPSTLCIYDSTCLNENKDTTSTLSLCNEPNREFCIEETATTSDSICTTRIASNLYERSNTIRWGKVNTTYDPYVIGSYKIGWRAADSKKTYYNVANPGTDGTGDCDYGGCDTGELIDNNEGTRVTATAPSVASVQTILGYDDDTDGFACWAWFYAFSPYYKVGSQNRSVYVLNCFEDEDCGSSSYCDKSSSWNSWSCVSKKSNGVSCTQNRQCSSGYCDNDGQGDTDDGVCFTPTNTYFDSQESTRCEISTGQGSSLCDEKQVGDDLNTCVEVPYREEECNSICSSSDVTSVFECNDSGCSCAESLCDGQTTNSSITACRNGLTYFADVCSATASGQDSEDKICRSSSFSSDCTADSACNGVVAGTGQCTLDCKYNTSPPSNSTITYPNGGEQLSSQISVNWSISNDPQGTFTRYLLQYSNNSGSTWNTIIRDYGSLNRFSDNLTQESLVFSGNSTQTIYVRIPKSSSVLSAKMNLGGQV